MTKVITFSDLSGDLYAPDAQSSLSCLVLQCVYDLMSQDLLSCDNIRVMKCLGLERILKRFIPSAPAGQEYLSLDQVVQSPIRKQKKIMSRTAVGKLSAAQHCAFLP